MGVLHEQRSQVILPTQRTNFQPPFEVLFGLGTCLLGMTGQAWAARLADQGQLAGVGALWVGRRP